MNTAFLTGPVFWFKGIGDPILNEFAGKRQWSFDLEVTPETQKWLEAQNLLSKIRKNQDGTVKTTANGNPFITFKKDEFKDDGTKNAPWRILDRNGNPWNGDLIGNGSIVRVKVTWKQYRPGIAGLYALAIQVGEHVPYEKDFPDWEEAAVKEAAVPVTKAKPKRAAIFDGPDDEVPF